MHRSSPKDQTPRRQPPHSRPLFSGLLAVAADAELRRRHPDQHYPALRSAEPELATDTQLAELTLSAAESPGQIGQWIKDLAASHRTFTELITDRQSLSVPSEDPRDGHLSPAFPT